MSQSLQHRYASSPLFGGNAAYRMLVIHICGPMVGELIGEAVVAMEFQASSEDLQRTIRGHPTLTEAVHEASLSVDRRAIHAINR